MTFAGLNGNDGSLYNTPKNVFMPRVGIAYQLNSKTVLRSGMGMFAGFLGERRGDVFQNGFTQNTNMTVSTDNGLHFATTLANPFPLGVAEPVGAAAGLQTYLGQGFTYFNQNPKIPVTIRWEASLQHQFNQFLPGSQLHRQQDQPYRDYAQHQHSAAPVSEHACPRATTFTTTC
jgi:hypothetical protein